MIIGNGGVSKIEKKINYIFHNKNYLTQAFTHKSLNTSTLERLQNDLDVLSNEIEEIVGKLEIQDVQKIETLPQKIFSIQLMLY